MWDSVLLDFDCNETINFGPRQELTDPSNVFEIQTLATISSSQTKGGSPSILSCVRKNVLALAVDQGLLVFTEEFKNLDMSLQHESLIESVALSSDAEFLLVGEQNGVLHTVYLPKKKHICKYKLFNPCGNGSSYTSMVFLNQKDKTELAILSSSGQLLILQLDLTDLSVAASLENWDEVAQKLMQGSQHRINLLSIFPGASTAQLLSFPNESQATKLACFSLNLPVLGVGLGAEQFKLLLQMFPHPDVTIKKVEPSSDGIYMFILDNNLRLHVVSGITFLLLLSWCNEDILDFTSISVPETNNDATGYMLVLLVASREKSCTLFQLRHFPSFDLHYSVELARNTWLINCQDQDSLLVLECRPKNNDVADSTLRLCSISQTDPEMRLAKLLRKGKFSDAETLARIHSLDLQDIHKAHASSFLEDLSMWKDKTSSVDVNMLIMQLEKITDTGFVVQCCSQAALHSSEETLLLLQFAMDKALKCSHPSRADWIEKIAVLLHRLEIFLMLFPEDESWSRWFEFSSNSFLKNFVTFLQMSDISSAFSFWNEHQEELSTVLTSQSQVQDIGNVLHYFPDDIPSSQLVPFLEDVLPHIVYTTETVDIFADWMIQRCQLLEITEKEKWPSNGLKLLEVLPDVCTKISKLCGTGCLLVSSELVLSDILTGNPKYHELVAMISDLKQLEILKKDFNCIVPFADFRKEDKVSVLFELLDRLADSTKLGHSVNSFFKDYTKQHQLDMCVVFAQYIEDILHSYQVDWRGTWEVEVLWEQRVSAILQYVHDPDCRVQAILNIVSNSPLPWSPVIKDIVDSQLETPHEMNEELENQVKLSYFKALLLKYNLQNTNDTQVFQLKSVLRIVNYIFKQGKASALQDALQVVQTFDFITELDIYYHYMISLLNNGQDDRFFEEFKKLKSELKPVLGERCFRFVMIMLNSLSDTSFQYQKDFASSLSRAAVSVVKNLKDNFSCYEDDVTGLKISQCFQEEFNLFVRPSDVISLEMRWNVFNKYLDTWLKETGSQGQDVIEELSLPLLSKADLLRIADILHLPSEEVNGRIAISLSESGQTEEAIQVCKDINLTMQMMDSGSLHSLVLFLLNNVNGLIQKDSGMLQLISQLCSQLVLTCAPEKLEEVIGLSQWNKQLSCLVALGKRSLPSKNVQHTNYYDNWHFSPMYKEQGLRLTLNNLSGLISTVNNLKGPSAADGNYKQSFYDHCRQVVLQLCSASLDSMCLEFLCHMNDHLIAQVIPEEVLSYQKKIMANLTISLISQIGHQRKLDIDFALGLVCLHSRENIHHLFQNLLTRNKNGSKCLQYISKLGIQYARMNNHPVILEKCEELYLTTTWVSRLAGLNVIIKNPETLKPERAWSILKDLFSVADMELIVDFCRDFGLDKKQALESYLCSLLSGPLLKNWGQSSVAQSSQELMELHSILSKASKCIENIHNSSELRRLLYLHLHEANPYCYEVIDWLLKQVAVFESHMETSQYEEAFDVESHQHIIKFLSKYQRLGPPLESEVNCWIYRSSEPRDMPDISSVRLPYHMLTEGTTEEKSKIINQEVYARNVKLWLSEAPLFQLELDSILVIAAQNEVLSSLQQKEQDRSKNVKAQSLEHDQLNVTLLQSLKSLVRQMENMDMAISCAFWIVKRLPDGPNKVAAAEESVKLTAYWISQNPSDLKARVSSQQFQDLYMKLAIKQELVKISLTSPKYVALVEKPSDLISCLLEEVSESGSALHTTGNDRFAAVKEIARIGKCDLRTIYASLLETWLLQENRNLPCSEDDVTTTINMYDFKSLSSSCDHQTMIGNVERAVTLLHAIANEEYFLEEVTSLLKRMDGAGTAGRAQVMRALSATVDHATLQLLTSDLDIGEVAEGLSNTIYLARLEALGMPFKPPMFLQCNKTDLVVNILQLNSRNPKALVLCSSLCTEYSIWDNEIWNIILGSMTYLKMVDSLEGALWQLSSAPLFWHNSAFVAAWQYVLISRIQSVESSCDMRNELIRIYLTIFSCPCHNKFDSALLAEEFENKGQHLLSLCCLLTSATPDSPHQAAQECLLKNHPAGELREELCEILDPLPPHRKLAFTRVSQFLTGLE